MTEMWAIQLTVLVIFYVFLKYSFFMGSGKGDKVFL